MSVMHNDIINIRIKKLSENYIFSNDFVKRIHGLFRRIYTTKFITLLNRQYSDKYYIAPIYINPNNVIETIVICWGAHIDATCELQLLIDINKNLFQLILYNDDSQHDIIVSKNADNNLIHCIQSCLLKIYQ
jgi:hypothetical protein